MSVKNGFFQRLSNAFKGIRERAEDYDSGDMANTVSGLSMAGDAMFRKEQINKDVNAPGIQSDVFGQPIYNQEDFIKSNRSFREGIKGTVGRGITQGALGGLQAGLSLGGIKGAALGLFGGAIGGLIGGKSRRRQLLREATRREEESNRGVSMFNQASERFRENAEADDFTQALINRRNLI